MNDYNYFEVFGAGKVKIRKRRLSRCGGKWGLIFGVSWGQYGYCSGVMPVAEVKRFVKTLESWLKYSATKKQVKKAEQKYKLIMERSG